MSAPGDTTLIDAVDDDDRPIGLVPRGEVFDRQAGFRTVHVLIFNSTGHLLLQQVGVGRARNPLRWGSSVAGYLHAGEDYSTGATRRTREEIGVSTELTEIGSIRMNDRGATKFVHVFTGLADAVDIAEPDHVEALRFWDVGDVARSLDGRPDDFTETFAEIIRQLRGRLAIA